MPVILAPSWFIAAAFFTIVFAQVVAVYRPTLQDYFLGAVLVIVLFGSVFLHELAHALAARGFGREVTELALTLWGGHTSYISGRARPGENLVISGVGPLVNLALGGAGWLLGQEFGSDSVIGVLLRISSASNLLLGIFNLLPGLPLDGGQVLESVIWAATKSRSTGAVVAAWSGRVLAVMVVGWVLVPFVRSGQPSDFQAVIWPVVIAGYLWFGATNALRSGRLQQRLASLRVSDLMMPAVCLPVNSSVLDAAEIAQPGAAVVILDIESSGIAVVDPHAAASVPAQWAHQTPVMSVAFPVAPFPVSVADSGMELWQELARLGPDDTWVAVRDDERVVGLLDLRDVAKAVQNVTRKSGA